MKGNITRRGERSWRIKFDLPRGIDGRRRTHFSTFRGTKKQAEAELIRLMNDANRGTYVDHSKLTVRDFIAQWDKDWASLHLSGKTLERYRQLVRLNIDPHIGREQLQKLGPSIYQLSTRNFFAKAVPTVAA